MKPPILVATRGWNPEDWARRFLALRPDRTVLRTTRQGIFEGSDAELRDIPYVLAWKPVQETIDRLSSLRVIFSLGAGVDHIFALPRPPEVPVVRIIDRDLTGRMTEYVVWQVLDHLRFGAGYRRHQRERRWDEFRQPAAHDVTVGLMGLGVMGSDAAEVLVRLGFKVRGWSRSARTIEGVTTFAGQSGLDEFLSGTDILVALLPLTPETRGLVDMALLRKLKRHGPLGGPVFINAGRGGLHVESDIVRALDDGTLAGASLDVFETEPLPEASPLWNCANLTITPHVAAVSNPDALVLQIVEQIEAFERGEGLRNLVDRERGY